MNGPAGGTCTAIMQFATLAARDEVEVAYTWLVINLSQIAVFRDTDRNTLTAQIIDFGLKHRAILKLPWLGHVFHDKQVDPGCCGFFSKMESNRRTRHRGPV